MRGFALLLTALAALIAAAPRAATADEPVSLPVASTWTGDLDSLVERRQIRVLVPYSRTFYFLDGGTQRGVSYEFMRAFEDAFNAARGAGHVRTHVVFIPTTRDKLLTYLVEGRGDVAAADLTVTEARRTRVDFTEPLARGENEVIVTGPGAPPLGGLDDLAGRTVYVRAGSSHEEHLAALNADFARRGLAPIEVSLAPGEFEAEDVLEMVAAGLYPIAATDRYLAALWRQVMPDVTVRDDLVISAGNDIAFAIRKDSPQLRAALDGFIRTHRKGTAFGNILLKKYVTANAWIRNPATREELAKFRALVDLFKRYAERYGVDWLLMAAQGYQESRLDHSVVSPVGAVGVMQVMPQTGKDMGVGDITELEANVHAGIKYVRWVIDHFYADEPMDLTNKTLFAFASYNAGPGRIRGLRKEAARRGLDPNRWFNHVEHVAAEKIGRETVTYVANIFKYYVAYKMIAEQAKLREQANPAREG